MANNYKQANSNVIHGDGAPATGDGLCSNLGLYPIGTIYVDSETGTVYVRNTADGDGDDWVSSGGAAAGGLELESYQNNAMSAPVMAYVFRDEDDNIMRVYEPIRNNDITAYTEDYDNSIGVFKFDNIDWFNVTSRGARFLNPGTNTTIQNAEFGTKATVNFNGKSTNIHRAEFGVDSLVVVLIDNGNIGDGVDIGIQGFVVMGGDLFDIAILPSGLLMADEPSPYESVETINIGSKTFSVDGDISSDVGLYIKGFAGDIDGLYFTVTGVNFAAGKTVITVDETIPGDTLPASLILIKVFGDLTNVQVGANAGAICQADGVTLENVSIPTGVFVNCPSNLSGESYCKVNNMDYKIGESGGNATLTAV